MAKRSTKDRTTINLPKEFLTPINITLGRDDDANAKAVEGRRAYDQKLIDFAKHYDVPLETPNDILALHRTLDPVAKQFAGFEFHYLKRAGARREKTSDYYWRLAVAYELATRRDVKITKKRFAEMVATSIVNPKQRRVTSVMQAEIKARADQIRNDLTQTNHSALRGFAKTAVDLFEQGLTPEEITQRLVF